MVVAQGELGFLGSRLDIYTRGMIGIQSPGFGVDDDDRDQGRGRILGSITGFAEADQFLPIKLKHSGRSMEPRNIWSHIKSSSISRTDFLGLFSSSASLNNMS